MYFISRGLLRPDEGNSPFQDKPYEVTFRATNGLSLLKDIPLVDSDGNNFTGTHKLIEYIAGALKQTNLDLPIRVFCNYYNTAFANRVITNDMFNQAYLEYRTFMRDSIEYVSCYEALMIILDKFCRIEYWNGMWLIKNIAELQYSPGRNYYTDYNSSGVLQTGGEDTTNQYQIGKAVDLYPINEDQQIYSRFAIKSAKTVYNYEVWPEIPKNNKFERGTEFESGDATDEADVDNDGDTSEIIGTYKKFTIPDWEYGKIDVFDLPHPAMNTIPQIFYRRSIYNIFGVEINREIIGETDPTDDSNHAFWLRSEGIPVVKGGKINFSLDKRFQNNFGGGSFTIPAVLYMVVGGDAYYLNNNYGGVGRSTAYWRKAVNLAGQLLIDYPAGSDTRDYASLSISSDPIPFDGIFYIALQVNGPTSSTGDNQYYKNISFEYTPFVADGYVQVKGDYWIRSQNKVFPDVDENEVRISDSPQKVFKGALLKSNGDLITPEWFRYGANTNPFSTNPLSELRHFKELLNISRFNHNYRRMYALDGSFNGLNCAAQNDQLNKYPIRFDKRYRLVDMSDQREFVLVPPLKMDLIKGWISASMVEVRRVAGGTTDGTQSGDSSSFNYKFD
jgi:hypothetical protein